MKKTNLLFFLCLLMSFLSYGQNTLDCDVNIRKALRFIRYLESSNNVEADSLKAIEFLNPCVEAENAMAQLFMARLYLNNNSDEFIKKGFKLTRKAAKQDLPIAAYDLGVLFKYGKGVNQNLFKAAKWFRKGHNLGNSKAAYSLGYMFLKGFGGENQDYKKAVKWFKKSEYPMAKHWLAVCYYFGYGVKQDKLKAKKLLEENEIEKSEILLSSLEKISDVSQLTDQEAFLINELNSNKVIEEENRLDASKLLGTWTGSLLQFDWSKKSVTQRIPTTLILKKDSISDQMLYEAIIGENQNLSELLVYSDEVKLDDLSLEIKHPYPSIEEEIQSYSITPSKIKLIHSGDDQYIVSNTESFINDWKEPGAPLTFLLKKEKKLTDNNVEISDEALDNLTSQTDFIKLYPNPFDNDLVIAYELPKTSDVNVKLTSVDGSRNYNVAHINQQTPGLYVYHFNGSTLPKGMYVVSITYGGERQTKMIIKN